MALFFECMHSCAQKCLTPPTLSETRFCDNNYGVISNTDPNVVLPSPDVVP